MGARTLAEYETARWTKGEREGIRARITTRGGGMVGEGGRTRHQSNANLRRVWVSRARVRACDLPSRFASVGVIGAVIATTTAVITVTPILRNRPFAWQREKIHDDNNITNFGADKTVTGCRALRRETFLRLYLARRSAMRAQVSRT